MASRYEFLVLMCATKLEERTESTGLCCVCSKLILIKLIYGRKGSWPNVSFRQGTEECHEILSSNGVHSDLDSNLTPPEYES